MIKIFTDTSANLPRELVKENEITVVPFHYSVGEKEFTQDLEQEFDGKAFYKAMKDGLAVKTSMINTESFCRAFEKSLEKGDDIIYVGMSSGISGTFHSAVQAAAMMREQYPQRQIAAIDTKAASLGEGLPVLHAVQLLKEGRSFEEITAAVQSNADSVCQYFTVEDLEYLKRGGRISKVTALVGNILNIKPLLQGDCDGKIVLFSKMRGRKKALSALASKYKELVSDFRLPVGIAHADSEEDAGWLKRKLQEFGLKGSVLTVCYEPVTGSHVGPGTIALFFYGIHR